MPLLIHDSGQPALKALGEIVGRYRQAFTQESVLWESAAVCAAFEYLRSLLVESLRQIVQIERSKTDDASARVP